MLTSPMTDLVRALRRNVLRREVTELTDSDLVGRSSSAATRRPSSRWSSVTARWCCASSGAASFGETENETGLAVQHWDLATGKVRAALWAPAMGQRGAGTNAVMFFASLSANGKTLARGGAEERDKKKVTGTSHVWDVQSLATTPPTVPK